MRTIEKRKTSMTLDASVLDQARELGLNVSAIADVALREAVAQARRDQWLKRNEKAFAAQRDWHESNGHPLTDIMAGPGRASWTS